MSKIIGIDLGTTNSCVSVMEGGEPIVISNMEGSRTTPSVVGFTKDGERLVGNIAKRQATTNSQNTIFSIKRFMGRNYNEVSSEEKIVSYKVEASSTGDCQVNVQGQSYRPPEISAIILQKMKETAEAYLGDKVEQAVITVPAYFNDAQRQATKDAGRIAGLDVLRIINEPTAAALAYGLERKKDEKIVVYDLGGGTFDVSILTIGDDSFEVLSTDGDTHLGGDDFDQTIITWLAENFLRDQEIDLRKDVQALQRLREAAEKAKCELSFSLSTEINLPFVCAVAGEPKHLVYTLTRAKLDQLCDKLLQRTKTPCIRAMESANLKSSDISEVILVGGMTRMPAVGEVVKGIFGKDPHRGVNPDEVVAIGAAIQGGVLSGEVKDVLLLDVTPLSLGIETLGGICTKLIDKNTTIPVNKSQIFSTAADNQPAVTIHVLQGEREFARDNRTLGRFDLVDIMPAARGVPQIEVTFDIDSNGIVHVSAKDKATNKEQKIKIESSSGLSEEDIQRMIREAEEHVVEDQEKRKEVEIHNNANSMIYTTEKTLKEQGEKVSPENKEAAETAITELRTALEGTDSEVIKNASEKLMQASHKISEAIYAEAAKQQTEDTQTEDSSNNQENSVNKEESGEQSVDAEFKVVEE